jgi:hypothetical protein
MDDVSPERLSGTGRVIAAVVAVMAASPLVVAASLAPAASGVGTHRALGLPECGWQVSMNLPCPTCGMTTAFAHAARAEFLAAAMSQPAGLLLSIVVAMIAVGGAYAAGTGAPMQQAAAWLVKPAVVWVGLGLLLLGWGFKLLQSGAAG